MLKIKSRKKIIIGVIASFIVFILAGVAGYFYFKPSYKTFFQDGISFSYPKELNMELTINEFSVNSAGYADYKIQGSRVGYDMSYISISAPTKNTERKFSLSNRVRSDIVPPIKSITINKLKGKYITYYLNEQLEGDVPVKANITKIFLSSKYPNAPIMLSYFRSDADPSLDETWNMILKTLKANN